MERQDEQHSLRGPIDRAALISVREVVDTAEPLAETDLDDYINPSVLQVTLSDGMCDAETARIDIQWTTRDDYKYHYTDSTGVNLRWGKHPHGGDYIHALGPEHYHPPPEASSNPNDVENSCIEQSPEALVTRAVLKLWRVAYHTESLAALNAGSNPP